MPPVPVLACSSRVSTYIRRRLIPYYDSGPLHKHQIYVRPIFHFVPLVESGICLLVDVATLSTIYDVRHPLLLPPGYPTQALISRATNFPPFSLLLFQLLAV